MKRILLVIDPQNDFMDLDGATLPVTGATADMDRVAALVREYGDAFGEIKVTMDTHRVMDIAHPGFWLDENGNHPAPFTVIFADDIHAGKFVPRHAEARPPVLGGKSIKEYAIEYAQTLEQNGQKALIVWPEHCLIGSWGHNIYEPLLEALNDWERRNFATVEYVAKGTNIWTEHYGGFRAEVPFPGDPGTELNVELLERLQQADELVIAGEALSHCVMETVNQVMEFVGDEGLKKLVILEDCASPVPQVGDGPDFPAIAQAWLEEVRKKGVRVMKKDEYVQTL